MLTQTFLRAVPEALTGQVASGSAEVVGSIVRDAASKQIVGHLQPTGVANALAGQGASLLGSVAGGPVSTVMAVGQIAQNEQIKQKLDVVTSGLGQVQKLQFTSLATSVVGIGVTVASSAIILNRLGRMSKTVDHLSDQIDSLRNETREASLREVVVEVRTGVERYGELGTRRESDKVAGDIEHTLDRAFEQLFARFQDSATKGVGTSEELRNILEVMAVASGVQIRALLWREEMETAEDRLRRHFKRYRDIAWFNTRDVMAVRLSEEDQQSVFDVQNHLLHGCAGLPLLIAQLREDGIAGRQYLEELDSEEEQPLLYLPATEPTS